MAEKEHQLKKLEIEKLKEQWALDVEAERQEKQDVINANKQVYKDIEDFNRREEIVRNYRSGIEKTVNQHLILTYYL